MKSLLILFLTFLVGISHNSNCQMDNYSFSHTNGADSLVGNLLLNPIQLKDDQPMLHLWVDSTLQGVKEASATGEGIPIGFDFWYDGQVFDRVAISGNGYIKLGKSSEPITIIRDTVAGAIFDGAKEHQNIIASFQAGSDLARKNYINKASITTGIAGFPGDKTFTTQYLYKTENGLTIQSQIQLKERGNKILFVLFGKNSLSPFQVSVGLTGVDGFTLRKVTYGENNWSTSLTGTNFNDRCDFFPGLVPNDTYVWSPNSLYHQLTCPEAYLRVSKEYKNGGVSLHGERFKYLQNADSIPTNSILEWSNSTWQSNQETQYDVYLDTDNPPTIQVADGTSEPLYNPGQLAPNTTYYLKVVPQNDSGSVDGCITTFTTAAEISYCEPYNYGAGYLQQFSLNELAFKRTSANELSAQFPQESPYTTGLKRDTSYQVAVTLAGQIASNPWTVAAVEVFIDFNQDGDFKDEGETLYGGYDNPNQSFTFDLDIPETALLGTTLMRVRTRTGQVSTPTDACEDYWMGGRQDFTITILPQTGCEDFSISPITQNLLCHQDSSGSINLNPSGGQNPYTVEWLSENNTEINRTNLQKGTYQAIVSDANGCTYQTPLIAITQPQTIYLKDSVYEEGTAVDAQGGTPPYSYLWDNGTNEYQTDTPPEGIYTLIITDEKGCKDTSENIRIEPVTGIKSFNKIETVRIYPNPVQDGKLQITAEEPIDYIEIRNVLGVQVAYKKVNATTTEVHMEKENRGIYFVTVKTQTQEVVQRVLVEK